MPQLRDPETFGDLYARILITVPESLTDEQRATAAAGLAQNWAANDPEGAAGWALSLKDPEQRTSAISAARQSATTDEAAPALPAPAPAVPERA
jgi:hypothetical protein